MLTFEVASRPPIAFYPFGRGTSIGPCAMEALSILLGGKKYTDNPEGVNYDLACVVATVNDNLLVSPEMRAALLWRYLPSLVGTADLIPRRCEGLITAEAAFPMETLMRIRGEEGLRRAGSQTPVAHLQHLYHSAGHRRPGWQEQTRFIEDTINAFYEYKNAAPRKTDFTQGEVDWLRMYTAITKPSAINYFPDLHTVTPLQVMAKELVPA